MVSESYLKMEEEEKGSAGFDKTGTLVVATNEEVEKVIKTGIALAKAAGYTGEYITDKDRIKEILPGHFYRKYSWSRIYRG